MTLVAIIALVVATAFDIVTTIRAKSLGAIEANPLLRWSGSGWIALRVLFTVGIALGITVLGGPAWVGFVVAGLWMAVGFWNLRNTHVLERRAAGAATGNGMQPPFEVDAATGASGAEADQPRRGGSRRNHGGT